MGAVTEAQLRAAFNTRASNAPGDLVYPRDWNQLCQAVMYQTCRMFGVARKTYTTAKLAMAASGPLNTDRHAAPAGAFHYWGMGSAGHVALSLGGERVLMGSSKIDEKWATNLGVTTVTRYNGADYRGWAHTNGLNDVTIATPVAPVTPTPGTNQDWYTSTAIDGIPGKVFWQMMQLWAREEGYNGPIDGALGKQSWAALQRGRKKYDGYTGPDDGVPGTGTWMALQRVARFGGYKGPIDGKPGKATYRALAAWLNGRY